MVLYSFKYINTNQQIIHILQTKINTFIENYRNDLSVIYQFNNSLIQHLNIMPSFDITSKADPQTLDNAFNVAKKEILNRFDFRDSKSEIELNKKDLIINITTEHDMRLRAIIDAIHSRMIKQGLDPRSLDESKEHYSSGMFIKKEIKIRQGIEREAAKKILKDIKDSKLKVTAQVMDDIIRVSAKSINDLQAVIALCRQGDYEVPLQFVNMK